MTFSKISCIGFMVGYFLVGELFRALLTGYVPLIFNVAFDGIVGIGLSIGFGYLIGALTK